MSLTRSVPKRIFTKKRTYQVPSPEHEETDIEYDAVKNSLTKLENGSNGLRNLLKSAKDGRCGTNKSQLDTEIISEHVRKHLHSNMQSINEKLKIEFEEDSSLRQENEGLKRKLEEVSFLRHQNEGLQRKLDAANDEFKKIDQELRIATNELKIKGRELDKATTELKEKNEELKYLKEQSTKTESDRKRLEAECVELQKRTYQVPSPEHEETDIEYDAILKSITKLENGSNGLRNLLKSAKEGRCGTNKSKLDTEIISEHVRKHLHSNMQSINEKLKTEFEEDSSLRQENEGLKRKLEEVSFLRHQNEGLQRKLDAANDEFKKIDQELRIATNELKIKGRELDKATTELKEKNEELKYLKEQSTKTESDRKRLEAECVELQKRKQNYLKEENKQILQQMETLLKVKEDKIKSLNAKLQRQSYIFQQQVEDINDKNDEEVVSLNAKLQRQSYIFQQQVEEINDKNDEEVASLNAKLQRQSYIFQQQVEEINDKNDEEVARLQNDISSMENIIQQLQNERQTLEKEQQHKEEALTSMQNDLLNMESIIQQFQTERQTLEEERKHTDETLTSLQNDLFRRENLIQQLQKQRDYERQAQEEERQHKDEALTRLSAIAGDRLSNNSPGIPDLCDPNRPMKIAEKFTEMFDNDWIDSMEALEDLGLGEEKCVEILLHFVTDSYEECERIVGELNNNLKKTVMVAMCDGETNQSEQSDKSSQELPAEITKPILGLRRKLTDNNIEALTKKLPVHLKKKRNLTEEQMSACQNFIRDCIRYTWMMQIQDPPVHMEWAFPRESDIDSNLLRSYTKAGEKVDYIVWPILYLHKGGAVLNKGVVQPFSHRHNGN